MRNPDIPEELRGTYAGLAHPSSLEYLQRLGVTAVELMPVHHFVDAGHLVDRGLVNYWGYDSVGYFSPESRYSAGGGNGDQVREFKAMVRALHAAGLEVILDVVYNHTGEGNHLGPTLSFRGHRQPVVLPARRGRTTLLLRCHRHRQQPQRQQPDHAAADHRQSSLLGDRDARRRVPIRSRRRPRAPVL